MGDDGVVDGVPVVLVPRILARDRVAHAVAEMDTRVAEPDTGQCRGQKHLRLGFKVIGIFNCAGQVFDRAPEGLQGEDIRDGVRALVGGAVDRVRRTGDTLVEGDGGPRFKRMAEHIQTRSGMDGGGHGACVDGITDTQGGLEGAVCDASFSSLGDEIEDCGTGGLRASTGRGRYRDEGLQWLGDGEALAERGVDEVEEVGVGEDGVKVHELGGVDDGATA